MANQGLDLKLELVNAVRKGYKDRAREVRVFTADPRVKEDMPCVAVNRIYDSEDDKVLGDIYDETVSKDGLGSVEINTGLFTQTCELRIWTENADERDAMFVELKEILILAQNILAKKGFGRMSIRGGRDENDFRTYAPIMLYWGVLNFSALSPFDAIAPQDNSAPPITAVDTSTVIDGVEQPPSFFPG